MILIITLVVVVVVVCHLAERTIRSFKVDGFAKKYVFITGCDSGFGRMLAIHLDRLGFPVFAACLTQEGERYLSLKASSRLSTLSLDVTKTESIQEALMFVKRNLPPKTGLWAIVNNAGISGPVVPTELCPLEGFYNTLSVNLYGPVEICRRFLPLVQMSKGRIVNMSSISGRIAFSNVSYNASKYAMEGFSDTLRQEVYNEGVKVSILEPGGFITRFVDKETIMNSAKHFFYSADEDVRSAYNDFLKEASTSLDIIRGICNRDTQPVVDAYTHAIVSRFPKTRYVVGWDAHLFSIPLSYFPSGFTTWFFNMMLKRSLRKKT